MRHNVLEELLQPNALEAAKKEANQIPPTELVQLLMEIDPDKRVLAFRLLDKDKAIAVFEYLRAEEQAELIQAMEDPKVMELVEALPADERVRLFEELPAKVTKRLIPNLSPNSRETVNRLLGYPERSAGRIMNLRLLAVRDNITVGTALEQVRESNLSANELAIVFLIDKERYYKGFVQTVSLIKASPEEPISEFVEGTQIAASVDTRDLQAAKLLKDYDLPAIPVLDREGRLVGDITFDDVIDLVEEEATDAAYAKAGVGSLTGRDRVWSERLVRGAPWYAIRLRILFLIVTLVGGFLVGGVIERFEETLEAVVVAAVFIPLVMDMGGNVGTQSSTIFARGLAWNQIDVKRFYPYLFREIQIGLMMGAALGVMGGLVALFWQGIPNDAPEIGLAVGLGLFCVILLGSVLGACLPWVMLKLGFDHGPGADPFITTIKDFVGLLIYFSLVDLFLGVA